MRFMASTDKPRVSLEDGLWLGLLVISVMAGWRILGRDTVAKPAGRDRDAEASWDTASWLDAGLSPWDGSLADLCLCLAFLILVIANGYLRQRQRTMQHHTSRQCAVYAAMLDAIPHPLFCEDAKGRCLAANEACERVFDVADIGNLFRPSADVGSGFAEKDASGPGRFLLRDRSGVQRRYRISLFLLRSVPVDAVRLALLHEVNNPGDEEGQTPGLDSALMSAMGHDLRTPMTGILGALELLGHSTLDSHQRRLLHGAESASRALQGMLEDVLILARLGTHEPTVELEPFDPGDISAQEVAAWRAQGMDISASMADGIGIQLAGCGESLKHALHALWRYAMAKSGHAWELSVSVLREDDASQDIEWLLESANPTCDALVAGDDCVPASSGHHTELLRRLAGKWCERAGLSWWEKEDGDARVRLGMTGRFEREHRRSSGTRSADGAASRIVLVAEDHEITRTLLRRQLEILGWECDMVSNGNDALEALSRRRYAILLTDCQMPGMDGLELARRIRATEGTLKLPIIALTADPSPGHREHCLRAGMNDVLPKSTRLSRLADTLRIWQEAGSGPGVVTRASASADPWQVDAMQWRERMRRTFGEDTSLRESYLRSLREEQTRLRAALATGDVARLRQVSHSLSGMSAFFGANSLSSAASSVERSESQRDIFEQARRLDACIGGFIDEVQESSSANDSFSTSTNKVSERSHRTL